jgi:protein TonB
VQRLEKIVGDINSARDYPKASRKLRNGSSVIIQMRVGSNGRASNCKIITPSPDAEADRITCRLAVERFRFRPRTNATGIPVPGEYRWRQKGWDPRD